MDLKMLNKIADADTSSKFWGSAVQEKAQEILGILCSRSWCEDEYRAGELTAWAEYEYLEFVNLLKGTVK